MEDLVRKHSCFVITLFLLANWTVGLAQSWEGLPALRPSYQNDFSREYLAYSGSCFNNVLIDDAGRMWLNACGLQRAINSLGLFSFDGYRTGYSTGRSAPSV